MSQHVKASQPLVPSVLDRLLDAEPDVKREPEKSRVQILRDLKISVRRDLESLLNTRKRAVPFADDLNELEVSLVNYGIPDFTGQQLSGPAAREEFRRKVEAVIRVYEPRFKTVKVTLVENDSPIERTLRFRIDGLLYAEPAPEPVVFDTALEPSTGSFEVTRVGR